MYVNTVFFRKPGTGGGINRIQEDFRKWLKNHYKHDFCHVSEISPNGLVHIHSIIRFPTISEYLDYMEHVTNYETLAEKNKVFVVKVSDICKVEDTFKSSNKDTLSKDLKKYYTYMHKNLNKNNYLDKYYRVVKILSNSILSDLTREYNKEMNNSVADVAAALADARPKGGSGLYTEDMFLEMD